MSERAEITLEISGQDFTFNLTPQDVTKYFNAVTANNKVAPSHNLLVQTVQQEQLATLKAHLVNPVITMKIASTLLEEYAPDVEVTVKKRSATLSA